MIIRETSLGFIMVGQHDHAQLSGEVARHFRKEFFPTSQWYNDALEAVFQHDRSWIGLDDTPVWNDQHAAPMSFVDYPLIPKLTFYQKGLDETEAMNPYAALLCSMHYTSFLGNHLLPAEHLFMKTEKERQRNLRKMFPEINQNLIHLHFQLLQLCDNISLYVCLNEPGIGKQQEHPWFQKGFSRSEAFNAENRQRLMPAWLDTLRISIHPFPFDREFSTTLKFREVSRQSLETLGMRTAYAQAPLQEQEVIFCQK